jgi:hypothetical protein
MMTPDEYKAKQEELQRLVHSLDLYRNTPQTKAQKKKVNEIWQKLEADTFAHECAFLDTKLNAYSEMLAIMKQS